MMFELPPALLIPEKPAIIRAASMSDIICMPALIGLKGIAPAIVWQSYNNAAVATVTLNPSDKSSRITLSGGNLVCQQDGTANHSLVRATNGISAGKKAYWEFTLAGTVAGSIHCYGGLQDSAAATTSNFGGGNIGWSFGYSNTLALDFISNYTSTGTPFTMGNGTYGVAYDFTAGLGWIRNSGGYRTGNPTTGASPSFTLTGSNTLMFAGCSMYNDASTNVTFNFGASAFTYAIP